MGDKPLGGGFIIVGRYQQQRISACVLRCLTEPDGVGGVIGTMLNKR